MSRVLIYFSLIILFYSCTSTPKEKQLGSGVINYHIDYPQKLTDQAISNILPEEMALYYTPSELKFKIKGDLNIFMLEYLSRANGDSCYTLFKVVNRKLYYPLINSEQWFLFDKNPPIIFKEIKDSTKIIAGINCHLVKINYRNDPDYLIKAYFTNDIVLNKALLKTPFDEIDGIPLQFEVLYNNMTYKFRASKINNSIGKETMDIPSDYKLTSRKEIHELVNSILN